MLCIAAFCSAPHDNGGLFKAHRLSQQLSQSDLAERAGVSRLWAVQTERGNPGASLELVLRTLAVLDVTLSSDGRKSNDAPPGGKPRSGGGA